MNRKPIAALLVASTAAVVVGCGSSSDKPAPKKQVVTVQNQPGKTTTVDKAYNPKIDPARFSSNITNPYLPWRPGKKWVYTGQKDHQPQRVEVTVTSEKKKILGVECIVVRDLVTVNHTLHEKTVDWYAQDDKGNVWYFGEDTAEYVNGVVSSTAGTWEAGVDNAKAGIVMPAHPRPGGFYRQEYRPGIAEDKAKILSITGTQKLPAGVFTGVVETRDIDPLNPDKKELKWYARGVGAIHVIRTRSAHTEEIKLVRTSG
jgi:hypothetical protein